MLRRKKSTRVAVVSTYPRPGSTHHARFDLGMGDTGTVFKSDGSEFQRDVNEGRGASGDKQGSGLTGFLKSPRDVRCGRRSTTVI